MRNDHPDGAPPPRGARYENVEEYIDGFLAAIETHRKLTDEEPLEVEITSSKEIPLAQRILLR